MASAGSSLYSKHWRVMANDKRARLLWSHCAKRAWSSVSRVRTWGLLFWQDYACDWYALPWTSSYYIEEGIDCWGRVSIAGRKHFGLYGKDSFLHLPALSYNNGSQTCRWAILISTGLHIVVDVHIHFPHLCFCIRLCECSWKFLVYPGRFQLCEYT